MDTFLRDLRFSLRGLSRAPGFTAAAVVALALGIGATTAIFSVVHAVLLRSFGWGEESRLVSVYRVFAGIGSGKGRLSIGELEDLREAKFFESVGSFNHGSAALQSRDGAERPAWHRVACCPPNIMRQIAAVGHYVATQDDGGVQIHQYIDATVRVGSERDCRTLRLETDYPWDGRVKITVAGTGGDSWRMSLRVPGWCEEAGARLSVNGRPIGPVRPASYAEIDRAWSPGDVVELALPVNPRWIYPHPRIDAIRGTTAIARGPLVYCLEEIDQPEGTNLLDVRADTSVPPRASRRDDLLGGVVVVEARGAVADAAAWGDRLYSYGPPDGEPPPTSGAALTLTAIPYYAWANRGKAAMRVWIPRELMSHRNTLRFERPAYVYRAGGRQPRHTLLAGA
jgi:hypothetical protein